MRSLTAVITSTAQVAYRSSTSPAESLTVTSPIITSLPVSIDSLLQSVLGGLPGDLTDLGPAQLKLDLPPILGGSFGGATALTRDRSFSPSWADCAGDRGAYTRSSSIDQLL